MSALDDLKAYAKKFDLPLIEKEDFEDRIVYIEDWMDVDINGRITHAVLDCEGLVSAFLMVGKLMRPGNKSWIDTVNYGTDDSIFEDSTDVYETSLKELVHIKELDFDL